MVQPDGMRRKLALLFIVFGLFAQACDKGGESPTNLPAAGEEGGEATVGERRSPESDEPASNEDDGSEVPAPPADPLVVLPQTDPPQGGWPTVVMLHGYRSNERDFAPVAQLAAERGLAAVSLPAPFESGEGQYHWKPGEPEHTHRYVQHTLERLTSGRDAAFSTEKIWLVGFSQGALHSVHLAAKYPKHYAGVLAVSPAGFTEVPDTFAEPDIKRHFVITGGRAEKARYRASFDETRQFVAEHKMPLEVIEHEGGHQFPPDWQATFGGVFGEWAGKERRKGKEGQEKGE